MAPTTTALKIFSVYQQSEDSGGPVLVATSFDRQWAEAEAEAINHRLQGQGIPHHVSHAYVA